ncbi:MAG: ABC transporter permease, partial [Hyphomicrobiales bacterium]|nr:ABC transporter permease [Hyphomicrobiales bacterium]
PILLFLLAPLLIVVPMALTKGDLLGFPPQWISIRHFAELMQDEEWLQAFSNSMKVAALATAIALVVGTSSALALHRSRIPFKGLITTIILAPIMVPVVVLALGDYLFLANVRLVGSWVSIGLAHSVIVTPFVFVAVQASLTGLDPSLMRAARSLGGGNVALFRDVYWPAIRTGILGGAIFAFVGSFDEVVVALFLAGPASTTLPVQMFTSIQYDLTPKIAAVSSLLFAFSVVALSAQAFVSGGRAGAS